MKEIRVLDCTLRDGGYCNDCQFGFENTKFIIDSLLRSGVDIIECGFLTQKVAYKQGVTRFNTLEQVKEVLPQDRQGKTFVILMDYGACDVETIPDWDGSSVDGIRVTFHKKDMLPALEQCRRLKEKGYKTFLQPMVALRYTDAEYLELIRLANEVGPYAFYLVDSFGTMKRKDMLRFFYMIEHNLREDIVIGFHSHNNLQLAYANAQTLVDLQTSRSLILDSSIMGMGRGAGNLNSELFLEYLNDNAGGQYRVKPLLRVIDRVLNDFYQQNQWGYSLPNYLSASHNAHPNYALFLTEKNTLTVEDIDRIFDAMAPQKRASFDRAYIEKLYLEYMERNAGDSSLEELRQEKDAMMATIYNMLCVCLGKPPKTVTLEVRNKKKEFIRDTGLTGKEFFQKYVGWDLSQYVSLINAPTAGKPYHRTYTVKFLGNVVEGRPVKYLNLPVEDLKAAAIAQMKDGQPVWFGCDVGQCSLREGGVMDLEAIKADELFGTQFSMDKAQRLDYGESLMNHAMVFQGVDLDENGSPTRWRVENSWGKEAGENGYYVMSDEWFTQYTYQVVVNKKYLTAQQAEELSQEPIPLEPWDPMGSLA